MRLTRYINYKNNKDKDKDKEDDKENVKENKKEKNSKKVNIVKPNSNSELDKMGEIKKDDKNGANDKKQLFKIK